MSNENKPTNKDQSPHKPNKGNEEARQPDPETLGTTDPQEHMKGPVSSAMQKIKEEAEDNDAADREEVRQQPDEKKR
jgi:hypothetical protein